MTSGPGHIELERSIDSIQVGSRHRSDLGDIEALATSIEKQGLLQPITVTPDGVLVCGARRLAALRQLGVRKLNVWVRSGISDRLAQLLAEQDDDGLHKTLSPTEAATLYREVKMLLAEDARRRQEASRFGALPASDGPAIVAAPLIAESGTARGQAARIVSGRQSYTTLELIGDLQRIAADESADEVLRARAAAELQLIDKGGPVASAHRRINTLSVDSELEDVAEDAAQQGGLRDPASRGVTLLRIAERSDTEAELEQLAKQALARTKTAVQESAIPPSRVATLPVRSFVFLWNDLNEWWLRYDPAQISAELTDSQWEQFEATLAGTNVFAQQMRACRAGSSLVAAERR